MAVLEIITAPHPILEGKAREVAPDEFGPALERRLKDMAETMYAAPGVGLAAPQVSDPRRAIVIDGGEKEDQGNRLHLMVNPQIVEKSAELIDWRETCLSVPDLEVDLKRHKSILVRWQDPLTGDAREARFEDFESVIVQHELDHLKGTVLLDKVSSFKRSWWLKKQRKAEAKEKVRELAR